MKKIIITLVYVTVILGLVFAGGAEEEGSAREKSVVKVKRSSSLKDLEGRTIVAVTGNDYVPLNFIDPKTGNAIGFEYDLTNTIGYLLNAKIEWKVTSWDTMINAVREGQFDVGMDGITITAEREEIIDFSDAYLKSQQVMLVRADETRFASAEEFAADKKLLVGSQAGTTQFYTAVYEILDGDENNERIVLLDNFSLVAQSLISGDVDLVLMDKVSAEGYIGANADKLKIIGDTLGEEDFGYIFTPGSDLTLAFNQAIKYLKSQGVLDSLEEKWFYEYKLSQ